MCRRNVPKRVGRWEGKTAFLSNKGIEKSSRLQTAGLLSKKKSEARRRDAFEKGNRAARSESGKKESGRDAGPKNTGRSAAQGGPGTQKIQKT